MIISNNNIMILDHFGPFGASRHAPESAVPVLPPPAKCPNSLFFSYRGFGPPSPLLLIGSNGSRREGGRFTGGSLREAFARFCFH